MRLGIGRLSAAVGVCALAAVAAGCGSSRDELAGHMDVAVHWPSRTRYVAPYAGSVVAQLSAGGNNVQVAINRESQDAAHTVTRRIPRDLPPGTYSVDLAAYTGADGAGEKVGQAQVQVEVREGQLTYRDVSADLQSTIDHLVIKALPAVVPVGATVPMEGTAEDAANNTLLIPASAFTWSIVSGQAAASVSETGVLSANAPGTARVRLEEVGAGKSVEADVTIVDDNNSE